MPSRCPWHQSITPAKETIHTCTHTFSQNNSSSWTAIPPKQTETHTHLTYIHFLPHLPLCVSRPRAEVPFDGGSSVLHGQVLHCRGLRLLRTLLQSSWHHDPRDFQVAYRTTVVPVGIIVYSTLSTVSVSGLFIVIAMAVHRFVCFWEVICLSLFF